MNLEEINALAESEFVAAFAAIYERSPWVAEAAAKRRPFSGPGELEAAMWDAVAAAPAERQTDLLLAHPDLAGKLARDGALTRESQSEQASAGLDRLSDEEFDHLTRLNAQYRERFGFPFIVCVREHDKASIIAQFEGRLAREPAGERASALSEVRKIARLRIADLLINTR